MDREQTLRAAAANWYVWEMAREQRDRVSPALLELESSPLRNQRSDRTAWIHLGPSDPNALLVTLAGIQSGWIRHLILVSNKPSDSTDHHLAMAVEEFARRHEVNVVHFLKTDVFLDREAGRYVPEVVLAEVNRMVGPGGKVSFIESASPTFPSAQWPGKKPHWAPDLLNGRLTGVLVPVASEEETARTWYERGINPGEWLEWFQRKERVGDDSVFVSSSLALKMGGRETVHAAQYEMARRTQELAKSGTASSRHVIIGWPAIPGNLYHVPGGSLVASASTALRGQSRDTMSAAEIGVYAFLAAANWESSSPRTPARRRVLYLPFDQQEKKIFPSLNEFLHALQSATIPPYPKMLSLEASAAILERVFPDLVGTRWWEPTAHDRLLRSLEQAYPEPIPLTPEINFDLDDPSATASDERDPHSPYEPMGALWKSVIGTDPVVPLPLSEEDTYKTFLKEIGTSPEEVEGMDQSSQGRLIIALLRLQPSRAVAYSLLLGYLRVFEKIVQDIPALLEGLDTGLVRRFLIARLCLLRLQEERDDFTGPRLTALKSDSVEYFSSLSQDEWSQDKRDTLLAVVEGIRQKEAREPHEEVTSRLKGKKK